MTYLFDLSVCSYKIRVLLRIVLFDVPQSVLKPVMCLRTSSLEFFYALDSRREFILALLQDLFELFDVLIADLERLKNQSVRSLRVANVTLTSLSSSA